MARKITLLRLLDDLRAEARLSPSPAHNQDVREMQVRLLQRVQERLWEDYAWPHLEIERQVPIQTGQRYYDPPGDILIDKIIRIDIFRDGGWRELVPGFCGEEYRAHNSDLDERAYPPRRWRIYEEEQVEVWPISDQNADATTRDGYLRYRATRKLNKLVDDNDRCDLDGRMITLYAAAELLAAKSAPDAQLKLDQANQFFKRLRNGMTPRRSFKMFGIGEPVYHTGKIVIGQYRPAAHN